MNDREKLASNIHRLLLRRVSPLDMTPKMLRGIRQNVKDAARAAQQNVIDLDELQGMLAVEADRMERSEGNET